MEYGLCVPHYGKDFSLDDLRTTVQRAEALGYHSVWVSDHVVPPPQYYPQFGPTFYDPFVMLTYMAAFSKRLKVGSTVIVVPYRNPLVVAKMLSTLDVLSGGRVIFGVGLGSALDEFQVLGVPLRQRAQRADEYIRLTVALWTQDPTNFQGEYFSFKDVRFQPKPIQKPHPPIWVGGVGEAALRRAVALGDAWHPMAMPMPSLREKISRLRELAQEAGRSEGPQVTVHHIIRASGDTPIVSETESRLGKGSYQQIREDMHQYEEMGVPVVLCNFLPSSFQELWGAMVTFATEVMAHSPRST